MILSIFSWNCISLSSLVLIFSALFYWVVCLLLWSCKSSLYFLDTNPLPGICFANIFTESVTCLFIFFVVSFEEPTFNFLALLNLAPASLPTATSLSSALSHSWLNFCSSLITSLFISPLYFLKCLLLSGLNIKFVATHMGQLWRDASHISPWRTWCREHSDWQPPATTAVDPPQHSLQGHSCSKLHQASDWAPRKTLLTGDPCSGAPNQPCQGFRRISLQSEAFLTQSRLSSFTGVKPTSQSEGSPSLLLFPLPLSLQVFFPINLLPV